MSEQQEPPDGPAERFVRECREIDLAFFRGKLHEWVQEKLNDEQRDAGIEPAAAEAG